MRLQRRAEKLLPMTVSVTREVENLTACSGDRLWKVNGNSAKRARKAAGLPITDKPLYVCNHMGEPLED